MPTHRELRPSSGSTCTTVTLPDGTRVALPHEPRDGRCVHCQKALR